MTNGITRKGNLAAFVGIIMKEKAVQQQIQKHIEIIQCSGF